MPVGDKQLWAVEHLAASQAAQVLQSPIPAPALVPAEPVTWCGPAWLAECWDGAARALQREEAAQARHRIPKFSVAVTKIVLRWLLINC